MSKESSIYPISPEMFQSSRYDIRFKEAKNYLGGVQEKMQLQQPHLELYTRTKAQAEEADELEGTYWGAAILLYDVVSRIDQYTQPIISPEDLYVHEVNLQDQNMFQASDDERIAAFFDEGEMLPADSGLGQFMRRMEASSAEMTASFVHTLRNRLTSPPLRRNFLRGVYDVYMPFYHKKEASHLHDHLVMLPFLTKAIESGFYQIDQPAPAEDNS